jgi:CHASE2 domain-containing sensor protein
MGASFPLAAYLYVGEGEHEGAGTGIYYLANVLGNVAGAFVTGFVLIPWVGANVTTLWFCAVGLLFGLGCTLRHSRLATAGGCAAVAIALMALFEFFPRNWVVYPPDGAEVNGVKYLVDEGPDGIVKSTI